MTSIKNVTTAGAGVMGSQVSWMTAWHGKNVTVYDAFEDGIKKGKAFHDTYGKHFMEKRGATEAEVNATKARLRYTTDLKDALKDADLIIEQVPENMEIKKELWKQISELAPQKTIFCTNTSSLLPSEVMKNVDRPERSTTLHFCVNVWEANVGEIMMISGTSQATFDTVCEFAKEIGLVPIPIHQEQPGYVLNSLLIPFAVAALQLLQKGVCTPQYLDRTWRICMEGKIGPAQMIDKMGMNVCYHIAKGQGDAGNKEMAALAEYLKTEFIDKGKTGLLAGEGYYTYPNPEFEKTDFLYPKN
ncbi:3-hydroxyacyl-CoA dehydrogenase [Nitrosomonas sp. Nm84]|uniref:3-hydroxyacyl-CoA dehydrogenase n=1 Tax=Nitrosomonas sp. Nm84 TaxID=200124 RepID=UPI000D76F47C|nr:3-hydroxyacyl-CoA dehydrogenase [Nitrosomonas sp. Nm84]PXW91226.1 3-hydroxyacyl-CoA dehydrogenase [Nitrosomonas sp. Nm84]